MDNIRFFIFPVHYKLPFDKLAFENVGKIEAILFRGVLIVAKFDRYNR